MKSETIKKIAVIEFVFIFVLFGLIIISGIIQGRKNTDYKTEIDRLEKSIVEFGKTNTGLAEVNAGLESDKLRLEGIVTSYGEKIQRLENISNQLRKDTKTAIGIIDEIEKLFAEILGD